jgi:hypothetical protein
MCKSWHFYFSFLIVNQYATITANASSPIGSTVSSWTAPATATT